MILIHADDIKVPEGRYREEFNEGKLRDLREGIARVGLIAPLTVEKDGDTWKLRAGERRLRALRELYNQKQRIRCGTTEIPLGLIPCVEWNQLTELQRLEIEVQENLNREDFNWKERSRAIEDLHRLRQSQNPQHTITATATELAKGEPAKGDQVSRVSNALIINKHLDDPDVAKAKDEKEALKIIKKKTELIHQARLAKSFDVTKSQHKLLFQKGNSFEILQSLPKASYDVILTDPPYGVGAHNFGSQASTGHNYKDTETYFKQLSSVLADESYRVAKERAHAYIFCDVRKFEHLGAIMVLSGWTVFPTPIYWYKGNGMVPFPKHGPRRTVECILYAWKGDRETLVLKNDCITRIPGIRGKELEHGAQKPVALYCELLSRSARPGDTVLDCFGGRGTILVAANIMKLQATYIENDEEQFNAATQRAHIKEIDDGSIEDDGLEINIE